MKTTLTCIKHMLHVLLGARPWNAQAHGYCPTRQRVLRNTRTDIYGMARHMALTNTYRQMTTAWLDIYGPDHHIQNTRGSPHGRVYGSDKHNNT